MQRTITPLPRQHEAWKAFQDDKITDILYGGGAGGGKSYALCQMATVVCYELPGATPAIARKELTTLMKTSYKTLMEVFGDMDIPNSDWKLNGQYNWIDFCNGSRIYLLDTSYKPSDPNYDRFGGLLLTHVFAEEIPEWNRLAWETLQGRIGRNNMFKRPDGTEFEVVGKFVGTCNPTQNWVRREYYDPYIKGTLPPHRVFIPALPKDNHHLPKSYLSQLDNISSDVTRRRLRDGDWNYEETKGQLMKLEHISDMFTNTITMGNEKYITVDVARYGSDKIVYNIWYSLKSVQRVYKEKQGTDQTVRDIRDLAAEHRIPYSNIIIDDDGIGGGVVDHLPGVRSFVNNSTALNSKTIMGQLSIGNHRANFANLKAQCGFKLAEMVTLHKVAIENANPDEQGDIIEEISQIRQKDPDKEGKLQIVSKEEVKGNINRSPDVADTFLMRMWFEVEKDSSGQAMRSTLSNRPAVNQFNIIRKPRNI